MNTDQDSEKLTYMFFIVSHVNEKQKVQFFTFKVKRNRQRRSGRRRSSWLERLELDVTHHCFEIVSKFSKVRIAMMISRALHRSLTAGLGL